MYSSVSILSRKGMMESALKAWNMNRERVTTLGWRKFGCRRERKAFPPRSKISSPTEIDLSLLHSPDSRACNRNIREPCFSLPPSWWLAHTSLLHECRCKLALHIIFRLEVPSKCAQALRYPSLSQTSSFSPLLPRLVGCKFES